MFPRQIQSPSLPHESKQHNMSMGLKKPGVRRNRLSSKRFGYSNVATPYFFGDDRTLSLLSTTVLFLKDDTPCFRRNVTLFTSFTTVNKLMILYRGKYYIKP